MSEHAQPEPDSGPDLTYVGPFSSYEIVCRGRQVPFLIAHPMDGGKIDLTLDRRFGLMLTVEEAERFVPFLAHAIAVASGYTCHPDAETEPKLRHPFPRLTGLHFGSGGGAGEVSDAT